MTISNNDFIKDCVKRMNEELFRKENPNEKFLDDLKEGFNEAKKKMKTQPKEHKYELYIPNDLHWVLVKIAAEHQMQHEDYVESMVKEHVEYRITSEKIAESVNDD
jgi:hypothetical protein